ncbi:uncharacterized protein LOC8284833 [Ricinus communis]|uniref:Uncharacterized protein n=1 Tax=Ricinus communis TaxID=3988 RepID=B9RKU8_RICCO|nr:uncharacterized protein LOC8284833 [Ricinus communis]XP_015571696.1 uncharacterized protein LOC8284833 [Ricinus communis]EEF48296.1 conserved hypothetical protein [Ricinus communis]|eukprot:XP_002514342.1 uncharacterized protein LOC8284833 [Ricinus communis]
MDFGSRKTRFKNRTPRAISLQPLRCSVEHGIEIEGREMVIAPGKQLKVRGNQFSYEETVPEFHGMLRIRFVGEENNAATITARHVRLCADIFFNEDRNHRLFVTAIQETILDYIPFSWLLKNQGKPEVVIFMQPEPPNLDGIAGAAMSERS